MAITPSTRRRRRRVPSGFLGFSGCLLVSLLAGGPAAAVCVSTIPWTDPTATFAAGSTPLRKVHIAELRQNIDSIRCQAGMSLGSWSEPLTAGSTAIKASHIVELRSAVKSVYTQASQPLPNPWTDDPPVPGVTPIRKVHILELRTAVEQAPTCGSLGQACCPGATCPGGLTCVSGVCQTPQWTLNIVKVGATVETVGGYYGFAPEINCGSGCTQSWPKSSGETLGPWIYLGSSAPAIWSANTYLYNQSGSGPCQDGNLRSVCALYVGQGGVNPTTVTVDFSCQNVSVSGDTSVTVACDAAHPVFSGGSCGYAYYAWDGSPYWEYKIVYGGVSSGINWYYTRCYKPSSTPEPNGLQCGFTRTPSCDGTCSYCGSVPQNFSVSASGRCCKP